MMASHLTELVKAKVQQYRRTGDRVPSVARDYCALATGLKTLAETHSYYIYRIRETTKTFIDEIGLQSVQILGACPMSDHAVLSLRPETETQKNARNLEERTFTYEMEDLPDRHVRLLLRCNFMVQTQCERQLQACIWMLEHMEQLTDYEPLSHFKDALAEVSVAVMVANMSTRMPPRMIPTLHIHRVMPSSTGGDDTPTAASDREMGDWLDSTLEGPSRRIWTLRISFG